MPSHFSFKRILIINIFGIGDVLFTTPLISNIKNNIPDSFIGYVCNKRAAAILVNNPKVDKIFIYEKDDYRDIAKKSKVELVKKIFYSLAEIKKENFDLVIDVSLNKYASFLMWLVGIKKRVGFNYKNRSPFLTRKIKLDGYEGKHVIEYYLGLLESLGFPITSRQLEVFIPDEDRAWAEALLKKNNIADNDSLIGIVPGGGASWGKDAVYKRWPPERYAQLADKMVEKFSAKIILLGDTLEKDLCQRVAQAMRHGRLEITGQTSVGQFAALLAKCKLAVVNDGGPLHVAVAAGTKTVSIFGPVDENVHGPYPRQGHAVVIKDIACRPCYRRFRKADCEHHNCLNLISVEEVLEKVEQTL